MTYRFAGTFDELKTELAVLRDAGQWNELNENQKQFRHINGGILNWFSSTGTINFQGKPSGHSELERIIVPILFKESLAQIPGPSTTHPTRSPSSSNATSSFEAKVHHDILDRKFSDSELVIGLVAAVGTDLEGITNHLETRLRSLGYHVKHVRISQDIIPLIASVPSKPSDEYSRISTFMDAGNQARKQSRDNSILALGAASWIASKRDNSEGNPKPAKKCAYLIRSLKHPEEVERLRDIYALGFYLIGVHCDEKRRHSYLFNDKRIESAAAEKLMTRDKDEHIEHGQRVTDTFHMADFFVRLEGDNDQLKNSLWRVLDIMFGYPYYTPTFDEYAMFLAFAASLSSADLSRQVGAVIAQDNRIVATGSNDCPKVGGGQYWPKFDSNTKKFDDEEDGRDYKRGEDANKAEQNKIIDHIISVASEMKIDPDVLRSVLDKSRIRDLTEFGRVVHAEMHAILSCARSGLATVDAHLYCTTFPCHNCSKHIIASGIRRVIYIEPYEKSMTAELHSDAVALGFSTEEAKCVRFEPFVGIGPRRFFDLFSMRLSSGMPLLRKDANGQAVEWNPEQGKLRLQMLPCSYMDLELTASAKFNELRKEVVDESKIRTK